MISGDLRDVEAVRGAVKGVDTVFHLGALIAIPYSYVHPREVIEVNVLGTTNVLMAGREYGVRRIVHTSTSEVYGTAQYMPIDEDHPLQGQSPYSASKIGADKIVESFVRSFELPVATLRPFNTYGPRQSARAVIPTIITQALAKDEIRLGSLTPQRDLTFVADTVDGFVRMATHDAAVGQEVNIGADATISIGELANKILRIVGRELPIVTDEQRLRPAGSEVLRLWADNRKAAELIGWRPQVSLDEGLARTVEWIRAQPGPLPAGRVRSVESGCRWQVTCKWQVNQSVNQSTSQSRSDTMQAVILAGGKGRRLRPYTTVLPKPLMPLGDMPIIEVVLRQLAASGFDQVTVAVGYLAELLMAYCGDGSKFGLELRYSREEEPLGTAGPLALIDGLRHGDTFLVMNGDVLTSLDLPRPGAAASSQRRRGHHRHPPAPPADQLRHHRKRRRRAGDGLHRKAHPPLPGQHGHLRAGAGCAGLHPARPVPRPARPGAPVDGRGPAGAGLSLRRLLAGHRPPRRLRAGGGGVRGDAADVAGRRGPPVTMAERLRVPVCDSMVSEQPVSYGGGLRARTRPGGSGLRRCSGAALGRP